MPRVLRYLWASPNTLLGAAVSLLASHRQVVEGVLEAHGAGVTWLLRQAPFVGPSGAAALTLGHIVLGIDAAALDRSRAHERIHVRQYERWGPFFLPAYLAASAWAVAHGRNAYVDNAFEVEAYRIVR